MSLLEKIKAITVQSLNARVLIAMVVILSSSFLVFNMVSNHMQTELLKPLFDRFDELQLKSAQTAFEEGGKTNLREYLNSLDATFGGKHYLLNASGTDLLSGENRSNLLPPDARREWRAKVHETWIIAHRAADGRYWFTATGQAAPTRIWAFLPYYFIVLGATGILGWLAWIGIVLPIRRIASIIARFGHGNLSLRIQTKRQDEIGQLGRSFNQMAERLERLIRSERRLLADISHELRSPLARLKFAVKLARTSPDSNAALDRIERDINRMACLISDLLEITSVEGDPALQEMSPVPLREVVDELVQDCLVEADSRGCAIEVKGALQKDLLSNRELLRRAIENVLRNAIRYSPRDSTIRIDLSEADHQALIAVRDFGPGVHPELLGKIFDPFFRVEEARASNGGGSGLGLSIAKRAVQLHRGTIEAENASPGLLIRITIPIQASLYALRFQFRPPSALNVS
jgi:signal transduction histidine kinase